MQEIIASTLNRVVEDLYQKGLLAQDLKSDSPSKSPDKKQKILVSVVPPNIDGDYSTNMILTHSKYATVPPAELAEVVIGNILCESWCDKAEFVKPGFINIYCKQSNTVVKYILEQGDKFGSSLVASTTTASAPRNKILIEYVSANPTGPLHTGHGRAAALGSSLGNILRFIGHEVDTEFYLNDAGRQMNILTTTFLWRVLQHKKALDAPLLSNMYQGDYVTQMVLKWLDVSDDNTINGIMDKCLNTLVLKWQKILISQDAHGDLDANGDGNKDANKDELEKQLDTIIDISRKELGEDFDKIKDWVLEEMVTGAKQDLLEFGVEFTDWFYESSSSKSGADMRMLEQLKQRGYAYEKEGALWFSSSKFGDDKDRVLIRNNGELTYFGSDISYHHNKYEREYDVIIDILGADHHGYVNRIISSMEALGHDPQKMQVLLLQLVFLVGNGDKSNKLSMSTRKGKFQELRDLVQQVGIDATRFFYLMYKSDRDINFDVELALSQSKENPVYYVQYAHARICRIFDELSNIEGSDWNTIRAEGIKLIDNLTLAKEKNLIIKLNQFSPVLQNIESSYEVHSLVTYLRELASDFHSYYNSVRILEEGEQTPPRLCLCEAVRTIISTGLSLIGVSSPLRM